MCVHVLCFFGSSTQDICDTISTTSVCLAVTVYNLDVHCTYMYVMFLSIVLVLFSDFCDKGDGYIRGNNSVCMSPSSSGDNRARTGLVVSSLLSSVIVLLVWIILVIVRSRGVKDKYVAFCVYMHMHM